MLKAGSKFFKQPFFRQSKVAYSATLFTENRMVDKMLNKMDIVRRICELSDKETQELIAMVMIKKYRKEFVNANYEEWEL